MKGEYVEQQQQQQQQQQHPKSETTPPSMFSKLQPQHHPFSHNPFQLSTDDDNSAAGGGAGAATPTTAQNPNSSGGDGATIEVVRRPRGRPPGSKNKPKPPVIITRDPEPAMSPYILEVSGGNDVVEAIAQFSRRKNIGICVLTGSGTVANVTLRQPSTTPGAGSVVTFHGRFDILSVSATFLPHQSCASPSATNGFAISLAGPSGQIVGGLVAGALMAAGTVFIIAASFNNPVYQRLPPEDEAGSAGDGHSPPVSGGGESGHGQAESCGMSMYSCHLPSDVLWAPTARPPPPPPPY